MHYCDFCGKSQKQVKRMISANKGIDICNECVMLCTEILMNDISEFKRIDFDNKEEIEENKIAE